MLRKILTLALAPLVIVGSAFAADDDKIMGYYEGMSEADPIAMQVIARADNTWAINILVGEEKMQLPNQLTAKLDGEKGKSDRASIHGAIEVEGVKWEIAGVILAGKASGVAFSPGISRSFSLARKQLKSPTFDAKPTPGAKVLLDGTNLDAWKLITDKWALTDEAAMQISQSSLMTVEEFGSFKLHLEFMNPFMPNDLGQARGNSGVYIHGSYEVQVLDSFGLPPADNDCGGIYKQAVPTSNASYPPLTWQTYDIEFHAPKFDAAGAKTANARITVVHNGVTIHNNRELTAPTPGGTRDNEAPTGPLMLQHHHDAVKYRNIWLQPIAE